MIAKKYQVSFIRNQKNVLHAHAESESSFIDSIQGIGTIKVFNKEETFKKIIGNIYRKFEQAKYEFGKLKVGFGFISESVGSIITILAFCLGSYLFTSKDITMGSLVAIIQLEGLFIGAIYGLMIGYVQIQEASVAFDRIYELVSDSLFPKTNKELQQKESEITDIQDIEAKNISFRFTGCDSLIEYMNFNVKRGESVVILGENGSGKSTILQILLQFYQTESGELLINNIPSSNYKEEDVRKRIGYVPQDPYIFNGTLIDNILLGEELDSKKLQAFLEDYGFAVHFKKFPFGYNSLLGEEGINISGGQKKLVVLARALYIRPQVLTDNS